jgi:hypothetical protein
VLGENRVNRLPQLANTFAMDDADLENAAIPAGGQVINDQVLHVSREERMQIEHPING